MAKIAPHTDLRACFTLIAIGLGSALMEDRGMPERRMQPGGRVAESAPTSAGREAEPLTLALSFLSGNTHGSQLSR